jgi:hypothetical protein
VRYVQELQPPLPHQPSGPVPWPLMTWQVRMVDFNEPSYFRVQCEAFVAFAPPNGATPAGAAHALDHHTATSFWRGAICTTPWTSRNYSRCSKHIPLTSGAACGASTVSDHCPDYARLPGRILPVQGAFGDEMYAWVRCTLKLCLEGPPRCANDSQVRPQQGSLPLSASLCLSLCLSLPLSLPLSLRLSLPLSLPRICNLCVTLWTSTHLVPRRYTMSMSMSLYHVAIPRRYTTSLYRRCAMPSTGVARTSRSA